MKTWQNFGADSGTATTRWNYDSYRGWLKSKDYPDAVTGQPPAQEGTGGPVYTYTPAGRLATRVWKRAVTTTYTYNNAGDLAAISYTGGTPGTTYSYDRRGRRSQIVRNGITTTWTYNDANQPLTESHSGGTLAALAMNWSYDNKLRLQTLTGKNGANTLQSATYGYDTGGRLQTVTDSPYTATYAYQPNSSLINTLTFANNGTTRLVTTRVYDKLNRLTSISSVASGAAAPTLPLSFGYQYNIANQRTRMTPADGSCWVYQYDALGQVVSGRRYGVDGTPVAGQQFEYGFDDIGNRKSAAMGGDASDGPLRSAQYTANRLNQYSSRTVPAYVDILGIANPTAGVTVNGNTAYRKGEYFHHALNVPNSTAQYPTVTNVSLYGGGQTETGKVFMPASTENYAHDADGNLTSDDRWTYSWDGENRLVQMLRDTDTPSGARQKLVFEYDHQGRRIRKQFFTYSGGWQEQTDTIFLYNDWNLVAELNANSSNARVRTYVWGTDLSAGQAGLSGSMQGAGGVGGLLKLTYHGTTTTNAFVAYDGNGNVMALVDATNGATKARYEYGPFAEPIRVAGPLAKLNPVRFSTKYTDNESGFLYYGYRYYNPSTGRWLSRDPIGESGGENIYAAFANNALSFFDWLGLDTILIFTGDPRSPEGGEVPFTAAASAKKAELSGKGDAVLLLDVRSWSQVQSALQKNKCIRAIYFYVHHSPGIMHLDMEGEGEETNVSLWGGDLKRRVEGGYHTFHTSSAWKWDKSNTIKGGELYVYGCHSKSLAQPLGLWFFANGGYGISTTCYFPVVDGKTTPVNWWKYLWLVTTGKVKADGDHDDNPDADDKTTPPKKPGPPKKPTPPTPGSPKTGYGPMVTTVDMDGVSGGF